MNILLGSSSPLGSGGGINTYVQELADELLELDHQVAIACPTPQDTQWAATRKISLCITDPRKPPASELRKLFRFVRENHIDGVINSDNAAVQNLLPIAPCPVLVVGHLAEYSIGTLATHNHHWADYIVAISNDMQASFVMDGKVPASRCPIVHNGVRGTTELQQHSAQKTQLQVVFAGGSIRRKGADLVLESVTSFPERWRDIELHWFGEITPNISRKLVNLPFVKTHGKVSRKQLLECLKNADVFLLPSRSEGCPMAMLEAMSEGIVPISSNGIGAMRWLINSGTEGFILPLKVWPEQLTLTLNHLRDHPQTITAMKHATHRRFLNDFQMRTTAEKLIELLKSPTVDRNIQKQSIIELVHWHRPPNPSVVERLCWRLGVLRSAGAFKTEALCDA